MICNTYIQFFKTIAEPSRIELLYYLKDGKSCVHELVEKTGREQSAISHNLRALKERGFVESVTMGKKRCYNLTKEARDMLQVMDKHIKKHFHSDCKCGK